MSPLSAETYTAVLGPRSVGLYRGRDPRGPGSAAFEPLGDLAWSPALAALEGLLARREPGRARLRVLLGSHYARFCLVPWSDAIDSPAELQGYARLCFEDLYGAFDQGWSLRLSPEAAGRPRLAAALPEELLDRLRALARSAGLRLASVQPYLMAAFNRYRASLADDFLLLVAEPGRGSLLLARDGRWASVRSLALDDSDAALNDLVAREGALQGLEQDTPPALFLHAPGRAGQITSDVARLDDAEPGDPLQAMAMTVN
ncbi:hypothetical protein [Pseudomonas sp. Q1-7]|uniref:hypothetical protein n=1 Tax=Pseudomonas sp. Q1-7 TaxID=3020843 RepID=UPI002301B058|nr:hypothetical protein [Pseudomonas sp. Q1-7]